MHKTKYKKILSHNTEMKIRKNTALVNKQQFLCTRMMHRPSPSLIIYTVISLLAYVDRHAQLTRCFSAAELLVCSPQEGKKSLYTHVSTLVPSNSLFVTISSTNVTVEHMPCSQGWKMCSKNLG